MREFTSDFSLKPSSRQKKVDNDGFDMVMLAKYSSLGYYVVAPLFVGIFIGLVLDHFVHTGSTGILISIGIGFISTMYNLFKLIQEEQTSHNATRQH